MAAKKKAARKPPKKKATRKTVAADIAALVPVERIQNAILVLRGHRVMLDFVLAELYEVETKALNQAVRRNLDRFPDDFVFQLTKDEFESLRSQSVTSKPSGRGGRRSPPYGFTEHGVAMLSSVLRSDRAVQVNIEIVRAFVRLRQMLLSHEDLARQLAKLEKSTDARFLAVFKAIRMLADEGKQTRKLVEVTTDKRKKRRPIGFKAEDD